VTRRGRVRPPSAHALEREQEIYNVAAEIFQRKGYGATTLQDIADAVGLLKGSLYYYIDSKEDLLYEITRVIHLGAIMNLEAAEAVGGSPADRLRALIEGHLNSFNERQTWIRVFYTEYGHLTGPRRTEIMGIRRRYEQFVDGLLREGRADGTFCADLDPRILTNAILTMVNTAFLWYKPERDEPIETVARAYADFVMAGLRCPPGHDHPQPAPRRAAAAGRKPRRAASPG
jgi:TetR/AcrR family transcriptional regulator, cholesterol catabolism regulator